MYCASRLIVLLRLIHISTVPLHLSAYIDVWCNELFLERETHTWMLTEDKLVEAGASAFHVAKRQAHCCA